MSATSRVLVVDDSAFMRQIICDLIAGDSQFTIVATANNGREAIEAVRLHKPDVITMDLEMPEMNGLDAVEHIMRLNPVPIIMMSSISDDGTRETIKALQNGAFDFIRKPSGPLSPDIRQVGEYLLEKMRIAVLTKRFSSFYASRQTDLDAPASGKPRPSAVNGTAKQKPPKQRDSAAGPSVDKMPAEPEVPQTNRRNKQATGVTGSTAAAAAKRPAENLNQPLAANPQPVIETAPIPIEPLKRKSKSSKSFHDLVAIGTSTGGPRALHEVISSLPEDFPAPVLVVQHMPPKFTASLAQRLDSFSKLRVTEAEQGERVCAGVVYIAPGGQHLELAKDGEGYYIKLTEDAPRNGHRPSVDTMFESCAAFPELSRHAVIMTGMGNDGTQGMLKLNESGGASAIAETEETCVVYGMPRSAVEAGAAKAVLPLKSIASALTEAVKQ
ncbi:protein-glutamate methylesterase/protein-glutamine glutaminase [Paenibacillus sacheonensis]|uniref:Protein-glutamate methylesterase/protein-glutamine glutaminase n=1 Tax=Paenibacillus sacheonensis TaxID=742054 RepID=A0A7X4YMN6_9BACL|nr:chemotaxis response regulator protein-glutamate methylesterase [Paenibacillus sacheonensis]MBM7564630.1 two-component system chemotaxis response regulator CheB [Paenibacillus sacheonensis]NBC69187.1 chemotaxis-specific protein-glutamate methyltransferase CheB [Paenibacillus sacheonensis]